MHVPVGVVNRKRANARFAPTPIEMTSTPRQHPLPDAIRDLEHLEDLLSEPSRRGDRHAAPARGRHPRPRRRREDGPEPGADGPPGQRRGRGPPAGDRRVAVLLAGVWPRSSTRWGVETISLRPARRRTARRAAGRAQHRLPGRHEVRRDRAGGADLGDERVPARHGLPAVPRRSRIVAFSTRQRLRPMVPTWTGGCAETDEPAPVGEYAMSCSAASASSSTSAATLGIPVALIRLNYAVEMRYGVLVDLARKVWAGEPIDVTMGSLNAIWQADANADDAPGARPRRRAGRGAERDRPGDARASARSARPFGRVMKRTPTFTGVEAGNAYLNNAPARPPAIRLPAGRRRSRSSAGPPTGSCGGGESLGKPTHFETRDGKF